jgi:hypothetical protein
MQRHMQAYIHGPHVSVRVFAPRYQHESELDFIHQGLHLHLHVSERLDSFGLHLRCHEESSGLHVCAIVGVYQELIAHVCVCVHVLRW